jgi:hypothetical protein
LNQKKGDEMEEEQKLRKKARSVMIIFLVVIIPGYFRLFFSDSYLLVRDVDIIQLLATGILTGILIMAAKDYFKMKKEE